jgi:predicted transposase YdaD
MKTDTQIYTLLGADPDFLYRLTDGIEVHGPYLFGALDVKGLARRTDGVLMPQREEEGIWVIEFQAQPDPLIYHRLVQEVGLVGERHPTRAVRGFVLFAEAALDPATEPWHSLLARDADAPLRRAYLPDVLRRLAQDVPDHPLLAVFLPYLEDDLERLRGRAPAVYSQLKAAAVPPQARQYCLDVFQSWLMARFKTHSLKEVLKMLGELTPLEETRAYKELVAKGEAIGRQEGRQEGRQREERLILRQLQRRIGPVPQAQQTRIAAFPIEQLEALGEALLDFADLADLNRWLAER